MSAALVHNKIRKDSRRYMSSDTNGPVLEALEAVRQFDVVDIHGGTLRAKMTRDEPFFDSPLGAPFARRSTRNVGRRR